MFLQSGYANPTGLKFHFRVKQDIKVLRVLLFGERVSGEEPRFIFFRTCVFREEKR